VWPSIFRLIGVLPDVWLEIDQGIRGVITNVPLQALTHMLIAPIALILGPFQFFPSIRSKNPHVHHWTGRAYVTVCVVAGLAGLATAPFASGGPVAGLGFGILAVLWIGTTIAAWRAAVQRKFPVHLDALQLCDDVRRGDLAFADSCRVRARIC
jgi:hypothetical protein